MPHKPRAPFPPSCSPGLPLLSISNSSHFPLKMRRDDFSLMHLHYGSPDIPPATASLCLGEPCPEPGTACQEPSSSKLHRQKDRENKYKSEQGELKWLSLPS